MEKRSFCLFYIFLSIFYFSACDNHNGGNNRIDRYFINGTANNREILTNLFILLNRENSILEASAGTSGKNPEVETRRFAVIREIANNYLNRGEYAVLVNFLMSAVNQFPDDPYNTYYLFMTAHAHQQTGAVQVAVLYLDMIIKNYRDMYVKDDSIHLACLNLLVTLVDNPEQQVLYYEELLSRFYFNINPATTYFMLAQACEKTGDWNRAINSYTIFLRYQETNVPGFPNARAYARQLIDFNNSTKDWTYASLDSLVMAVKSALDAGSAWELEQLRAKANFFTRTWEVIDSDNVRTTDFHPSVFLRGNQIRYSATIDAGSTANEAYLRTWGWSQFISIWYFYFRKINFPADPEIHGRWEWAGVFYGENF